MSGRIAKLRYGPVFGIISNYDELDHTTQQYLYDSLAYIQAGMQFSPKVLAGHWDGVTHVISPITGTYPAGISYLVRRLLENKGYEVITRPADELLERGRRLDVKFNGKLHSFQAAAVKAVLSQPFPYAIIASPPRSGKTVMAACLIAKLGYGPTLFLCERLDIVEQTIECFSKFLSGVSIGRIADGKVLDGDIVVATIQSAYQALAQVSINPKSKEAYLAANALSKAERILLRTKLLIVDECFPAGTLVDGAPIEEIKVGRALRCFDHRRKKIVRRKVVRVFKKQANKVVEIRLENGKRIVCTPNHKIYTPTGYKESGIIKCGDVVLTATARRERKATTCPTSLTILRNRLADRSSYSSTGTTAGAEEEHSLVSVRVESVKIHEQGISNQFEQLCPGGIVYNLEVETHHNYFANDVLVHNCHHASSPTYLIVCKKLNKRSRTIGLSGTPFREDGRDIVMHGVGGPIVFKITIKELVEQGILVPTKALFLGPPKTEYVSAGKNYAAEYSEQVVGNIERNKLVVDCAREIAKSRTCLILVKHIKHASILKILLPEAAVLVGSGEAIASSQERKEGWEAIKDGKTKIVITTLADEGLDLPCHPKETLVLTKVGYTSVADIKKGDTVVSINGEEQVIEETDEHDGVELLSIHRDCYTEPLLVTPEHKMVVGRPVRKYTKDLHGGHNTKLRTKDLVLKWEILEARACKRGDFILSPAVREKMRVLDLKDVITDSRTPPSKVVKRGQRKSGYMLQWGDNSVKSVHQNHASLAVKFPRHIANSDLLLAALLGLYLSEGSIAENTVFFSTHRDEIWDTYILNTIARRLGLHKPNIEFSKANKGKRSRLQSWWLKEVLVGLCGRGAKTKRIPLWALQGTSGFRTVLAYTLLLGDGCRKQKEQVSYCSSSPALAYGVRDLLLTLGIHSSVNKAKRDASYVVVVKGEEKLKLLALFQQEKYSTPTEYKTNTYHVWHGGSATRIQRVDKVKKHVPVYSLQVSGDQTYTTAQGAVHNSLGAVIIAAGGNSQIKALQRLRCMTAAPGKNTSLVIDFMDNGKYCKRHSKERIKALRNAELEVVEECSLQTVQEVLRGG